MNLDRPKYTSNKTSRSLHKSVLILIAGIVLSIIAGYYTKKDIDAQSENEFGLICNEIKAKVTTRLYSQAQLLRSGSAYFAAADTVTRKDWHTFYESSMLDRNLPGIQGFGFSLIVPKSELKKHIKHIRNEGFIDFTVYPRGDRDVYSSIIYLEPFEDRNLRAFGYDMYSQAVRRAAMEKACDYDLASLTGKVLLVQETDTDLQAGTLMYVPVYKKGTPVNTVEERRAAIVGWVYSPYRMNDLMNGILGGWESKDLNPIRLRIYDNDSTNHEALLYDSRKNEIVDKSKIDKTTLILPIEFNGKKWTLLFTKNNESASIFQDKVLIVLLLGFVISLLLFFLSLSLFNTRLRAEHIADKLTTDLKESEEKFRAMAETSPLAIYMSTGIEQKGVYVNETFVNLFGYTLDEVPSVAEWWPKAYPDEAYRNQISKEWGEKTAHAILMQTEIEPMETIVISKDGSKKHISWGFITIGEQSWAFGQDLTQRKQWEVTLKESEARFKAMFFEAPLGIALIHSYTGEIIEANPKYAQIIGRSVEELANVSWMSITHPDDIQPDLDNMELLNSGKVNGFQMEKRYIHKNGDIIWINMTIAPIKVDDKNNPLHLCMVEDITNRKQDEMQLKETNESLEEMVYITSHDLQAPLVSMEGYATELLHDYGAKFDEEGKYCLHRLQHNSRRMHKLVLSLLDISRLNTQKRPLENFNLKLIIEKILLDLSLTIQKHQVKIIVEQLPELFADKHRIETVFRNLISNAINYGGKNIVVGMKDNTIYVKDDGIGIPNGQLERIFNSGERLKLNKADGVGMGLTFCKKVINQHNGKIWAESEGENKGTTIKIQLNL
jgi:PAS domain S-box-containing protein